MRIFAAILLTSAAILGHFSLSRLHTTTDPTTSLWWSYWHLFSAAGLLFIASLQIVGAAGLVLNDYGNHAPKSDGSKSDLLEEYPRQSSEVGRKVKVYFDGSDEARPGTIARQDCGNPFFAYYLLADGRIVTSDECLAETVE